MKTTWMLIGLCAVSMSFPKIVHAQSTSDDDKHFVTKALEGGNDEVALAQLAQKKSKSEDVKQFAQKMVDDHSKMGEEMQMIAKKIGVDASTGTSMGGKATMAKLEILSGDTFDKAYMEAMVKDHREDFADFNKEAQTGTNPAIAQAAKKGAKVISSHLEMAQHIAASHGVELSER